MKRISTASSSDPGFFEQRRERRARPLGVADRLFEPRLAQRAGREAGAAVAGALERAGDGCSRALLELVERERQRAVDLAADLEPPGGRIDERDVEVDQEVVEPDRRQVVAERLEREAVVAGRERELDGREIIDRGLLVRFDRHAEKRYALRAQAGNPNGTCPSARHGDMSGVRPWTGPIWPRLSTEPSHARGDSQRLFGRVWCQTPDMAVCLALGQVSLG